MTDDGAINLAWLVGCMILVVSALVARGLSGRAWIRLAALWVLIIGLTWALITVLGSIFPFASFT